MNKKIRIWYKEKEKIHEASKKEYNAEDGENLRDVCFSLKFKQKINNER